GQSLVIGPGPFGSAARHVAFTPEGRYVVVAGSNGTVSILRTPPPPYPTTVKPPPAVAANNPPDAVAHYTRAVALARAGKLDEAIAAFGKAIELNPKRAAAHLGLGQALLGNGRYGEAQAALARGLKLLPKDSPLRADASRLLQTCERFAKLA